MEEKTANSNDRLIKHTLLFSVFVLLAQILGLVRDLFLTRIFGVGELLDTYYMAFKIPDFLNLFYSVFLGSVVFIPLLTAAKHLGGKEDNREEVLKKVNTIGSMVLVLVLVAGILLYVLMPQLSSYLAPTWKQAQIDNLTNFSRLLLLAQLFFPLGILGGCIGMVYKKPFTMAISGFVYNLFILLGAVFLSPLLGIYGVIIGIVVGAVFFAIVQISPKEVREVLVKFRFEFSKNEWLSFLKKNYARFFAVLAYQLFAVLILYIAGYAGTGGVSIFSISYNLYMALFFVLGASLSTAAMPNISKLHVTGNHAEQKESLNNAIVYMFFVGCFFMLFGFVFAHDGVSILYYFSSLGLAKELQVATVFSLLILALPFFNILEIIRKYLYSTNQIMLASTYTILLLVLVVLSSLVLNKVFRFSILNTLCLSILFSNFFTLVFALASLEVKKQIDLWYIVKNSYKVLVTIVISVISFVIVREYIDIFQNIYFLDLAIKVVFLLIVFVFLTIALRDKVGINILRQFRKILGV